MVSSSRDGDRAVLSPDWDDDDDDDDDGDGDDGDDDVNDVMDDDGDDDDDDDVDVVVDDDVVTGTTDPIDSQKSTVRRYKKNPTWKPS